MSKIKFTLLFFLPLTATSVLAQSISTDKVPAKVLAAYKKKYRSTVGRYWERKNNDYKVHIDTRKMEYSYKSIYALFSESGKWMEEVRQVFGLPPQIEGAITAAYPDYRIIARVKMETPADDQLYEAAITKGALTLEVRLDRIGNIIKVTERIWPNRVYGY